MPNPLDPETCVYVEVDSGDGGNHTDPQWWLATDIGVNVGVAGKEGLAQPAPYVNQVQVRVHKGECQVVNPQGGGVKVLAEAWVCSPAWGITPSVSHKIGVAVYATPNGPSNALTAAGVTQDIGWTLPPVGGLASPDDPQQPGHRCLVLRAYPQGYTPDAGSFYLPGDRHACQHNICIIPCDDTPGAGGAGGEPGAPMGPNKKSKLWEFPLLAPNMHAKAKGTYLLRGTFDQRPQNKQVLLQIVERLRRLDVGLAEAPPPMGLQIKRFPNAKIKKGKQGFEAQLTLGPGKKADTVLQLDLRKLPPRQAAIVHCAQIDAQTRKSVGGISLAFFKVA